MKQYLNLIKFSHTIFAMPFAMLGFFLGVQANGVFDLKKLVLVILCMVFARSAAMAFNRYVDRQIDAMNPRTKNREIPSGIIRPKQALNFVILNSLAFVFCTYFINMLCFILSPVALLIILGYSYTKRFTQWCHFILGMGLALAPVGAYIAVTGQFHIIPVLFSLTVLFWVGGFDVIYALQDDDFDAQHSLKSIPGWLGKERALWLSRLSHLVTTVLIIFCGYLLFDLNSQVSWIYILASLLFIALLVFQHSLVKPHDLKKVNLAFFTTNGLASIIFCSLVILDLYV